MSLLPPLSVVGGEGREMIESLERRELFSAGGTVGAEGVIAIGPLTANEYAARSPKQVAVLPAPGPPAPNKEPDRDIRFWSNQGGDDDDQSTGGWVREDLRDENRLW
jgi:hypothetical protein